jgi:uncharacterized membrane protein
MNLSKRAERRIEKYLGGVERALRHLEPAERREIVTNLRTHIREGLAERNAISPTLENVNDVLRSMDLPQSYGIDEAVERASRAGHSRTIGRLGFCIFLVGIGVAVLSFLLGGLAADALLRGGLILSGVLVLCALGLGIAGWRDPYGKAAAIGAALTLIAAAFFIPAKQTSTGPGTPQPVVERQAETGD